MEQKIYSCDSSYNKFYKIIYRLKYEGNSTEEWREKFLSLNVDERIEAERVIEQNKFSDEDISVVTSANIRELLKFYQIRRN